LAIDNWRPYAHIKTLTMLDDSGSSANVKQAVPFFMVRNIEASVDYYINGIGFEMINKWIDNGKLRWCWLEIDKAALMLQEFCRWSTVDGAATHIRHRTNPSNEKLGEGVSIYFICEDALAIYKQGTSRGLLISEPFVGNKMWVVGLTDPDGYKIFFESLTDVPEETKYSDWNKRE
jgi:hypothetical protein